jgi:hypothetical protein
MKYVVLSRTLPAASIETAWQSVNYDLGKTAAPQEFFIATAAERALPARQMMES